MNLAVFDIDGTLTRPYAGEDASFLEGLELAFGFREVSSNWNEYPHVTDTGIVESLFQSRLRRLPKPDEMSRFQELYSTAFLARVGHEDGLEVPGASGFITALQDNPDWRVAMATGNCLRMAGIKLTRGGIPWREVPLANADDAVSRADLVQLAIGRARSRYGVDEFHHIVSGGFAGLEAWPMEEIINKPAEDLSSLTLEEPAMEYRDTYRSLVAEFLDRGEPLIPFSLGFPHDDFEAFLAELAACSRGEGSASTWAPHSTYWLVLDGHEVVGVSNLRHRLTDKLRREGGHIGYGVRPSARGRGFSRELLRQTLLRARAMGIEDVLITCAKTNERSIATILANGGALESEEFLPEEGKVVQRYWIRGAVS